MENILIAKKERVEYTENIIYETGSHWISFVIPIIKIILGVIGIFTLILSTFIVLKLAGIYFIYLFIKGILNIIYLKSIKIFLSSNYISVNAGILAKTIIDTPLNKKENVVLYQSLLGRLLNYGTFIISTGGTTLSYTLKNPLGLRNQILNII